MSLSRRSPAIGYIVAINLCEHSEPTKPTSHRCPRQAMRLSAPYGSSRSLHYSSIVLRDFTSRFQPYQQESIFGVVCIGGTFWMKWYLLSKRHMMVQNGKYYVFQGPFLINYLLVALKKLFNSKYLASLLSSLYIRFRLFTFGESSIKLGLLYFPSDSGFRRHI